MKKLVRLELQQIHPTQITAGMLEVDEKRKHFASLPAEALKRALKAQPIPAVLGRDGTHFATDHHHLARALFDAQINAEDFLVSDRGCGGITEPIRISPRAVTKKPFVLSRSAGGDRYGR